MRQMCAMSRGKKLVGRVPPPPAGKVIPPSKEKKISISVPKGTGSAGIENVTSFSPLGTGKIPEFVTPEGNGTEPAKRIVILSNCPNSQRDIDRAESRCSHSIQIARSK